MERVFRGIFHLITRKWMKRWTSRRLSRSNSADAGSPSGMWQAEAAPLLVRCDSGCFATRTGSGELLLVTCSRLGAGVETDRNSRTAGLAERTKVADGGLRALDEQLFSAKGTHRNETVRGLACSGLTKVE